MLATPHTLAGFTIVTAFKDNLAIGIPLAIASHLILDYINESGLSRKESFQFDALPSIMCYIIAIVTGQFWLFLLGSVCGNLPDLIDKKLYLSIFLPTKFKSTLYLHWQKPIINPNPSVTMGIGFISSVIIIFMLLYNG